MELTQGAGRALGLLVAGALLGAGCASAGFHDGRSALAKSEQAYLSGPRRATEGGFQQFWQSPNLRPWGLLQWEESLSWAVAEAPSDLLQTIRDELGRLNQRAGTGENISLVATVYRFERGGTWSKPTAWYELVARDQRGKVVWAADDKVEASDDLALSLVDSPSSIIAREILRKVRERFGI